MSLSVYNSPKKYVQAGQTIPFLVYSDLFINIPNFDVIERSFKYLFEVKVRREDGTYSTYSTVAIPPRPDNLLGFFDASSIVNASITYDTGTHKETTAQPCENSIVEFRVICTERYLNDSGEYVNGQTLVIGDYYGIKAETNEPLTQYVIQTTGSTTYAPLTHDFLLGKYNVLRPLEPLTLSWITQPNVSGNLLQFIHGDYGFFDAGTLSQYTGFTADTSVVSTTQLTTYTISNQGKSVLFSTKSNAFTGSTTAGTICNWTLGSSITTNSKTYKFECWVRMLKPLLVGQTNAGFRLKFTSTRVVGSPVLSSSVVLQDTGFEWKKLSGTFTTNTTSSDITVGIEFFAATSTDAQVMNSQFIYVDSASLVEVLSPSNYVSGGKIIVDKGKSTERVSILPSSYFTNVIPTNSYDKARFDTPIGGYTTITTGTTQDTTTGLYKNISNNIGEYFQLELTDISGNTIASSQKIYQNSQTCNRFENYRIKWLNSLGGWDYYTFNKVTQASQSTEKEVWKSTNGKISKTNSSTIPYTYSENVENFGYKNLNINSSDSLIFNSDWIDANSSKFFKELFTSTQVFLLNPEPLQSFVTTEEYDVEYPIIIEDTEVEYYNNASDKKLINITMTAKLGSQFASITTNI